jgi:hypothetical protein
VESKQVWYLINEAVYSGVPAATNESYHVFLGRTTEYPVVVQKSETHRTYADALAALVKKLSRQSSDINAKMCDAMTQLSKHAQPAQEAKP